MENQATAFDARVIQPRWLARLAATSLAILAVGGFASGDDSPSGAKAPPPPPPTSPRERSDAPDLGEIRARLKSPDPARRIEALVALRRLESDEFAAAVGDVLELARRDADAGVRELAVSSLREGVVTARVVELWCEVLDDPEALVRRAAADALRFRGPRDVVARVVGRVLTGDEVDESVLETILLAAGALADGGLRLEDLDQPANAVRAALEEHARGVGGADLRALATSTLAAMTGPEDPDTIRVLVALLLDDAHAVTYAAYTALERCGAAKVPALLPVLVGPRPSARRYASFALLGSYMLPASLVDRLQEEMTRAPSDVRASLVALFGRVGRKGFDAALPFLDSPERDVREAALGVTAVGLTRWPQEALAATRSRLKRILEEDPDAPLRALAVAVLGDSGLAEAAAMLVEAMEKDMPASVLQDALFRAGTLPAPESHLARLFDVYRARLRGGQELAVRMGALYGLERLGPRAAPLIEELERLLDPSWTPPVPQEGWGTPPHGGGAPPRPSEWTFQFTLRRALERLRAASSRGRK